MKLPEIHLLQFLREVFSEEGQGSFSRCAQGVIVLGVISWISYLVFKNHAMPDLGGPSLFVGTGAAGHYGLNQVKEAISANKGNGNYAPPPQTPPTT